MTESEGYDNANDGTGRAATNPNAARVALDSNKHDADVEKQPIDCATIPGAGATTTAEEKGEADMPPRGGYAELRNSEDADEEGFRDRAGREQGRDDVDNKLDEAGGGGGGGADLHGGPSASDATEAGAERRESGGGSEPGGNGEHHEYKVYKRRWFGLVQLTLLNIIVSWDWLTFGPVSASAALYFRTSETAVNWLSTGFMFAFVVAAPVVIYVLHLGPRPSIITAASLVLAGNWIRYAGCHSRSPAGGNFGAVMFGQILTGLAQPFVLAAPARYSDLWFTNRGRVAATAVVSLANPFGAALGQLIVPFWVSAPSDVSRMVLYVSIISSVCAVPSFFIPARPPTPAAPSGETPKLGIRESARILTSHLEFWLVAIPFAVYVGFFNSISSLLNQIMEPYGFSDTDAGIAGALLIVVGLVAAAVTSPVLDRTKSFLLAIKTAVPVLALSLLVFVWMPATRRLAGPYVVLSVTGASAFSLVPIAIEFLVEVTHPISPEVTSTIAWAGGQLLGGVFIVISDALKDGEDADPPFNMHRALIFTAVVALGVAPLPLCLGLFGRRDKVALRRVRSDEREVRREVPDEGGTAYRDA